MIPFHHLPKTMHHLPWLANRQNGKFGEAIVLENISLNFWSVPLSSVGIFLLLFAKLFQFSCTDELLLFLLLTKVMLLEKLFSSSV